MLRNTVEYNNRPRIEIILILVTTMIYEQLLILSNKYYLSINFITTKHKSNLETQKTTLLSSLIKEC